MIDLSGLKPLAGSPYFIASATGVLPDFDRLAASFPDERLFKPLAGKTSLSERNNPEAYLRFVTADEAWLGLYRHVKSRHFMFSTLRVLLDLGAQLPKAGRLSARFEFSSMPADGGYLKPHTDIPSKVVTIVVGMDLPGAWDPAWDGGTDVLRPIDPTLRWRDYDAPLDAFERVHTFEHEPNAAVVFVKTEHSWHAVGPIQGPAGRFRRTITINIERLT